MNRYFYPALVLTHKWTTSSCFQDVQEPSEGDPHLRPEVHRPREGLQPGAGHQDSHHLGRPKVLSGHRQLGRREEGPSGQGGSIPGEITRFPSLLSDAFIHTNSVESDTCH